MEADTAAQFEVEYPEKLKKLFEEDSSDQSYELPFEYPDELKSTLWIWRRKISVSSSSGRITSSRQSLNERSLSAFSTKRLVI